MPINWDLELSLAIGAATKASRHISLEQKLDVQHKGVVDLVTQVDLQSEAIIRKHLKDALPEIPILAEEEGGERNSTQWIVDPLDGTTNFVHGFPAYCVSIALMVDDEITVACIIDAVTMDVYSATKGGGAFCNTKAIHVSSVSLISQSLLLTGFPYDRQTNAAQYLPLFKKFLSQAQGIRRAGSAALDLCHIASGRADGYWEFGLSPWDIAAGTLIVEEAGGKVSDMSGQKLKLYDPRLLVNNAQIHKDMINIIEPELQMKLGGR